MKLGEFLRLCFCCDVKVHIFCVSGLVTSDECYVGSLNCVPDGIQNYDFLNFAVRRDYVFINVRKVD